MMCSGCGLQFYCLGNKKLERVFFVLFRFCQCTRRSYISSGGTLQAGVLVGNKTSTGSMAIIRA